MSLPWQASPATTSSTRSRQASSSSVLARGSYSTCMASALPRALELVAGSLLATWSLGAPSQNPAASGKVAHYESAC